MMGIHNELTKKGYNSYIVWGNGDSSNNEKEIFIGEQFGIFIHKAYSHLLCEQGFASWHATKKLIKKLKEIRPDIIHLHNLHGNFINIELLFNYLKENKIKTFWTFHDCWAFTGKCVYFSMLDCKKWKTQCNNCPLLKDSPKAYIDNSKKCFNKKKEIFSNMDLTIITPSEWLSELVKESFLKNYPVKVINNGIDIEVFRKRDSNFRKKYNLENKKIILGVASPWSKRKGLDDFVKLSKILNDEYKIVLIGVSDKQINQLPNNIIGIKRTENQTELAEIYSTSDILFNPTYEDNYPTVNLEAIACGTPVLTYDTGGSPEFTKFIHNKKGIRFVIEKGMAKKTSIC